MVTGALERFVTSRARLTDALVLLAGALLPLAFSPFNLPFAALLSLTLLAVSVTPEGVSVRRGILRFYLFSVGMFGVGVSWIYVSINTHGNASPLLASVMVALFVLGISLFGLIQGYLFMRFIRPLAFGLLVGFPCLWLLREWSFTWVLTGFPWLFVGYGFLDNPLSGYVPVMGIVGTGLFIVGQASLLAWLLLSPSRHRTIVTGSVIVTLWAAGFGLSRVEFVNETGEPLTVAAVQGNIDQRVKWRREMVGPIIDTYLGLTNPVWNTDIIVWPEAALTLFRRDAEPLLRVLESRAREGGAALILGLPELGGEGEFNNTAMVVGEGSGKYIKRRLVPFGEYVPLEGLLRGLIDFFDLPMSRNRPGPWEQPLLRVQDMSVGMSICYEIVYPEIVRASRPDLLVTISNDTWFGDSIGPWQHMQMARARALENGRYLVRGTNNGITAIVDERGSVMERLPQFESGVLLGEIRRMEGVTPYARFGTLPWVILACGVLIALAIHRWHVSRTSIR